MTPIWIVTLCIVCAGVGIVLGLRFGWVAGYHEGRADEREAINRKRGYE